MKRLISLLIIVVMALALFAACGEEAETSDQSSVSNPVFTTVTIDTNKTYYATINVLDYGKIIVKLDHTAAPKTVENFVTLASNRFYDGLTFHRIMEGFMMQGGDPEGNGTGGSDKDIVGEFTANGHYNPISHKRGVISMARAQDYDSASSQFFICHEDSVFLDGQYAAFGYVVDGMEVVDKICEDAKPTDNNGTIPKKNQPVIESIVIETDLKIESKDESSEVSEEESASDVSTSLDAEKTYKAVIDIKDYGKITLELDQKQAPLTVENFVILAESGFYDGLTFHRIMEGFMMQGGDPKGNGTGGSDKNIVGEFPANGHSNSISHKRGVISMARAQAYDSASSQFFICHEDSVFLDGQYAAFGWVTEGMEVVDKICEDATPTDNNGTISKDQQPVINSIEIIVE